MKIRRNIGVATFLALTAAPCLATEPDDELNQWPEGSAAYTSMVAQREAEKQDKRLNEIYQKLKRADFANTSKEAAQKALLEAQKIWVTFRDKNCRMWGELDGGVSNWKAAKEMVCKAEETQKRVKELELLFSQTTE